MNDSRNKIEEFKRTASSNEMAKVRLSIKVPENFQNLDYHAKNRADSQAFDDAIAAHLGVTITDELTWPDEFAQNLAQSWAESLPDA